MFIFSPDSQDYAIDYFEKTLPMSTYTFGLVISQLVEVNHTYHTILAKPLLKIWGRKDFHNDIKVNFSDTYCILFIRFQKENKILFYHYP